MPTLVVGQQIFVRHPNPRHHRKATVQRARPNNTYDVSLNDTGERLFRLKPSVLSLSEGGSWNRAWLKTGVKVRITASKANAVKSGAGVVTKVYTPDNERCDIRYDDGTVEVGVPTELLKKAAEGDPNSHDNYEADLGEPKFRRGAMVVAMVFPRPGSKGVSGGKYALLGEVVKVRENGVAVTLGGAVGDFKYSVRFEDARVLEVPENELRRAKPDSVAKGEDSCEGLLTKGCEVAVRYEHADDSDYGGVVGKVHPDGTVQVFYCDGTREDQMPRGCIRRLPGASVSEREVIKNGTTVTLTRWNMEARELHRTMHRLPVNTLVRAPGPYSDHCSGNGDGPGSRQGSRGSSSSSSAEATATVLLRGVVSKHDAERDLYDVAFDGSEPARGLKRGALRPIGRARSENAEEIEVDKRWARHVRALRKLPLGTAVQIQRNMLHDGGKSVSYTAVLNQTANGRGSSGVGIAWHDATLLRKHVDGSMDVEVDMHRYGRGLVFVSRVSPQTVRVPAAKEHNPNHHQQQQQPRGAEQDEVVEMKDSDRDQDRRPSLSEHRSISRRNEGGDKITKRTPGEGVRPASAHRRSVKNDRFEGGSWALSRYAGFANAKTFDQGGTFSDGNFKDDFSGCLDYDVYSDGGFGQGGRVKIGGVDFGGEERDGHYEDHHDKSSGDDDGSDDDSSWSFHSGDFDEEIVKLRVGAKVLAADKIRYANESQKVARVSWTKPQRPAAIEACHLDNSYDIVYEDGKRPAKCERVPRRCLRRRAASRHRRGLSRSQRGRGMRSDTAGGILRGQVGGKRAGHEHRRQSEGLTRDVSSRGSFSSHMSANSSRSAASSNWGSSGAGSENGRARELHQQRRRASLKVTEERKKLQEALVRRVRAELLRLTGGGASLACVWQVFSDMDDDGNGTLSRSELKQNLSAIGLDLSNDDIELLLNRFDDNSDNVINLEEFSRFVAGKPNPRVGRKGRKLAEIRTALRNLFRDCNSLVPDLNAAFDELDVDGNGQIDAKELRRGLRVLGVKISPAEAKRFCELFDKDGDNCISKDEFFYLFAAAPRDSSKSTLENSVDSDDDELKEEKEEEEGSKGVTQKKKEATTFASSAAASRKIDSEPGVVKTVRKELQRLCQAADGLDRITATFNELDRDGDGKLDKGEIQAGLERLGIVLRAKQISQVMAAIDADGDGSVVMDEFHCFVLGSDVARERATTGLLKQQLFRIAGRAADGSDMASRVRRLFEREYRMGGVRGGGGAGDCAEAGWLNLRRAFKLLGSEGLLVGRSTNHHVMLADVLRRSPLTRPTGAGADQLGKRALHEATKRRELDKRIRQAKECATLLANDQLISNHKKDEVNNSSLQKKGLSNSMSWTSLATTSSRTSGSRSSADTFSGRIEDCELCLEAFVVMAEEFVTLARNKEAEQHRRRQHKQLSQSVHSQPNERATTAVGGRRGALSKARVNDWTVREKTARGRKALETTESQQHRAGAASWFPSNDDYYTEFENEYGGDRSAEDETYRHNGLPGKTGEKNGLRKNMNAGENTDYRYRPSRFALKNPALVISEF